MENKLYIQSIFNKISAMKKRSSGILEDAKISGKLHYYFDIKRCKENEIIKLEKGFETIIKK